MKKPCPDLVHLDDAALTALWKSHCPNDLKNLGDRLLAESLPRFAPRGPEFYLDDPAQVREKANKTLEQVAKDLDINPFVLEAWESGEVRPPASLALIYANLGP